MREVLSLEIPIPLMRNSEDRRRPPEWDVNTAHEATQLKNQTRRQKGIFQIAVAVQLPPERLENGKGQEEGRTVPANLVEGVEFICDLWDRRCNYCLP